MRHFKCHLVFATWAFGYFVGKQSPWQDAPPEPMVTLSIGCLPRPVVGLPKPQKIVPVTLLEDLG